MDEFTLTIVLAAVIMLVAFGLLFKYGRKTNDLQNDLKDEWKLRR